MTIVNAKTRRRQNGGTAGIGVDKFGGGVIDPTRNVLDLFDAGTKRQDDLDALRDRLTDSKLKRIEDLSDAKAVRLESLADLRAKQATQLADTRERLAEKITDQRERYNEKISDLRERYGERSATSALEAIKTLATSTTETATSLATTYAETVSRVEARLGQLERTAAGAAGKGDVVDPQIAELVKSVAALVASNATGTGKTQGISAVGAAIIGVALFASAVFGVVAFVGRTTAPAQMMAPAPVAVQPPIVIQLPSGTAVK